MNKCILNTIYHGAWCLHQAFLWLSGKRPQTCNPVLPWKRPLEVHWQAQQQRGWKEELIHTPQTLPSEGQADLLSGGLIANQIQVQRWILTSFILLYVLSFLSQPLLYNTNHIESPKPWERQKEAMSRNYVRQNWGWVAWTGMSTHNVEERVGRAALVVGVHTAVCLASRQREWMAGRWSCIRYNW